jgi:hypothetical protein
VKAIYSVPRGEVGLTLLEVLAAAMIFSMVMTVLVGTSSTAVHNMGMSARRLEANLVADELLADLEIQMKQGFAPEIDEGEFEREQYSIRMRRTDLVPDAGAGPAGALGDLGDAGLGISSMLGSELPEVAQYLKQYDIEVSWIEQDGPQSVTRTTFAFDWQTAALEHSDLFAHAGSTGGNVGGGDDENPDDINGPNGLDSPAVARCYDENNTFRGHSARIDRLCLGAR